MKILNILIAAVLLLAFSACKPKTEAVERTGITEENASEEVLPEGVTEENHSMVMDLVLGNPKHQIRNIGILVYDGVNDLDMMGPKYVFGQSMGARTQLIAIQPGNIRTAMGTVIVPDNFIDSVSQLDILVIPGGARGTIETAYNDKVLLWIRQIDSTTQYTTSVCTGAWILGAAGLLQGKKATTNWYRAEEMLKKYGATFTNERFTQDGKYWTSAGVTAGMDMSLAVMHDIWGKRYTQAVMLDMEYDPAPPISGGTPEKTGKVVYWMMKSMYDAGVQPLIDSLENR